MQKTLAQFPFLLSFVTEALIIKKKNAAFIDMVISVIFQRTSLPPPPQDIKNNTPFPYNVAR